MITRFAPSPTGYMHIGNARTALICWLYARSRSGKLLLRIDDTDLERSEDRYVEGIKNDLTWLAMDWDICFNQRSRISRYDAVFNSLMDAGAVYPCYETPEELELKRKMMLKMGLPPIYDRSALNMTEQDQKAYSGRKPYFRLKIGRDQAISWEDEIRGKVVFQAKNISDPILRRTDGSYTYMFPSTVDDIDFEITHIVRGEDHVSNTAVQIYIMGLLGAKIPSFAHLPLLRMGGSKMSKRVGGTEIFKMRDMNLEPMAINSYMARIGTSLPVEPHTNMRSLVDSFDIKLFNQAPIKFELEDISKLNVRLLQKLPFAEVRDRLEACGIKCSEGFWYAVRDNINVISEVKGWAEICGPGVTPVVDDVNRQLLQLASDLLPEGEPDDGTWKTWLQKIKECSGCETRDILLPLRLALTGVPKGPEFAKLLPLIGRVEILRRLRGA
ncbi:glutamate--tRNA ligase [Anaplasma marginale]|uniref:glutamate--tRNA ligase n=1 Tax=Anaplasma marginale TaxID=770 RepID=UPI000DEFF342|nr:glutamate--tRNA ligase [Anaplasma marginale]KAA8471976.1 glutamate--tRNA ligase [Anaplasma marginale]KAB0450332.1 glutamate--tRNA ligase [Anaplasma marginale]RCL19373.1 glutamate--tRNA ligase [Anaplasma marginale]